MAYNLSELRAQLHATGYHIIPNIAKVPAVKGWNTPEFIAREFSDDGKGSVARKLARWPLRWPASQTIGVRLDNRLVVIDADINDSLVDEVMAKLDEIAPEVWRLAPMRFGAGPYKRALFCRLAEGEEPFRRLASHKYGEAGHCLEVFGGGRLKGDRCSRQFGIYGVHSYNDDGTAAAEYHWDAAGSALHEVAIDKLPVITRQQCAAIVDAFDALAVATGWSRATPLLEPVSGSQRVYDIDEETTRFDVLGHDQQLGYEDLEEGMRCSSSFFDGKTHNNRTKCQVGWSPLHDCVMVYDYEAEATHYPKAYMPSEPPPLEPPPEIAVPDWPHRGRGKAPVSSMTNAMLAIVAIGVKCARDLYIDRIYLSANIKPAPLFTGEVSDDRILHLRSELQAAFHLEFSVIHINEAVTVLANQNAYDPVVDMTAAAQAAWDGTPRLDRLAADYFHAEDTALNAQFMRKMMIAAVARARVPGIKFDTMVVLESPEGWDKSTGLRVLAGDAYFSDASINVEDPRDVLEKLAGKLIHEMAELEGMRKADVEPLKAYLSRQVDRARPAYGRHMVERPRRGISVGTTNGTFYLPGGGGNRRFWPITVTTRVDTAALLRDRFQIWGEAAAAQAAGESLVLDEALWEAAAVVREEKRIHDVWEDIIREIKPLNPGASLNLYDATSPHIVEARGDFEEVTTTAIRAYVQARDPRSVTRDDRRLAAAMKSVGWERFRNNITRGYRRRVRRVTASDSNVTPIRG